MKVVKILSFSFRGSIQLHDHFMTMLEGEVCGALSGIQN